MSVSDQSSDASALNVREHIARIDQILTQRIRDHAQIDPSVWACAPPWPFVVTGMVAPRGDLRGRHVYRRRHRAVKARYRRHAPIGTFRHGYIEW